MNLNSFFFFFKEIVPLIELLVYRFFCEYWYMYMIYVSREPVPTCTLCIVKNAPLINNDYDEHFVVTCRDKWHVRVFLKPKSLYLTHTIHFMFVDTIVYTCTCNITCIHVFDIRTKLWKQKCCLTFQKTKSSLLKGY